MKRAYLLYGLGAGLLLVFLQVLHYQTMIRDMQLELYASLIAVVFLALGVFAGFHFVNRKHGSTLDKAKAHQLGLTEREQEVLRLLAAGHSNQEIADALFLSLNTIKTHVSGLYQKMNVSRRTQAVQKAREWGLLDSPERVNGAKSPESMS